MATQGSFGVLFALKHRLRLLSCCALIIFNLKDKRYLGIFTRKSDEFAKGFSGHLTDGPIDVDGDEAEDDVDGEAEAVELLDPDEDVNGVHLHRTPL